MSLHIGTFNMKKFIFTSLVASFLVLNNASAVEQGEKAPLFQARTSTGKIVDLQRNKSKVILIDFWASWCAPCRKTLPWLNELHKNLHTKGLEIITLSVDREKKDAEKLLENVKPLYSVGFDQDGTIASLYNIPSMPSSYLIKDGKVISVFHNFGDGFEKKIEETILKELNS